MARADVEVEGESSEEMGAVVAEEEAQAEAEAEAAADEEECAPPEVAALATRVRR